MDNKQIYQLFFDMSGTYNPIEIFKDFVSVCAISLSNSRESDRDIQKARENEYLQIVKKHGKEKIMIFSRLFGELVKLFENEINDYLGEIYMAINANSKISGQFFTPYHISKMVAELAGSSIMDFCSMTEPACGSGGLILAASNLLKSKGIPYQEIMSVTAYDLDLMCVQMTYVQLSILGIKGTVINANALSDCRNIDKRQVWKTPTQHNLEARYGNE